MGLDSGIVGAIFQFGALGIVLVLIMFGWLVPKPYYDKLTEENRELRASRDMEQRRGDEAEDAGKVTRQLITALTRLATEAGRGRQAEKFVVDAEQEHADARARTVAGRSGNADAAIFTRGITESLAPGEESG